MNTQASKITGTGHQVDLVLERKRKGTSCEERGQCLRAGNLCGRRAEHLRTPDDPGIGLGSVWLKHCSGW